MSTDPTKSTASTTDDEFRGGLECTHCGCRHFYTARTRKSYRAIRRWRECRHCGRVMITRERIEK